MAEDPKPAADTAAGKTDPREKSGSDIATAPAKAVGTAETDNAQKASDELTLAQKIDALHTKCFADTNLGQDTPLWNAVMSFKESVKELVAASGV